MVSHVSDWPLVVVCEPDESTLESLCDHLTADRFNVLPAPTASDALRHCRYHDPDLMLVDVALPDASGLDVLREIRQADGATTRFDPQLPIIVVSGRTADTDRVRGLEEGADDYLSKPASYEELRARIVAVLRRTREKDQAPVRVGDLVLDPARRRVVVGEREVLLTNKEFTLLRMIAADPTRVFSKSELMAAIWKKEHEPGTTRTLDSHASRLRRKLDPEYQRYVVNCWGIGYRLVDA
jgi:DNA-binding response OmpR family regulator